MAAHMSVRIILTALSSTSESSTNVLNPHKQKYQQYASSTAELEKTYGKRFHALNIRPRKTAHLLLTLHIFIYSISRKHVHYKVATLYPSIFQLYFKFEAKTFLHWKTLLFHNLIPFEINHNIYNRADFYYDTVSQSNLSIRSLWKVWGI